MTDSSLKTTLNQSQHISVDSKNPPILGYNMHQIPIVFDNIVFSLQRAGGISVVWQELLSRFIKSGCNNLSFIEHPSDKGNVFRQKLDLSQGKILTPSLRWFTLERYCNPIIKSQDPFIFHSSYFRTCPNKNAINVTTVHDFTYDYFYKGKRRGAFLHLWQRNRAIRIADAVVCISENTKRDLLKFLPDVDSKKVHVIYNGVSEDYHVIDNEDASLKDYLLFVGERVAYKNGRWFAEAIKGTGYKVLFCGKPMTDEEKLFYDSTLGVKRYKVMSGLSNEELNKVYNSVKCLVYPSSYEGFGIPVLEAQRAGCPVIALNASSIPEVIGVTPLLMQELTKEELLGKLALLEDFEVRQHLVDAGLANAEKFSWDAAYEQYRALYEQLLNEYGQ